MSRRKSDNSVNAEQMVNIDRYPIDALHQVRGQSFAEQCREAFVDSGLCMLPEFVRPSVLAELSNEAESVREHAYFCKSAHNAYLSTTDVASRRQEQTYVGSVPYDRIGKTSLLNTLYQWDPLKEFIGAVLGKPSLHRFADPFGACSINVFVDGGEHGWHFDESEFTVTLMLQKPDQGGAFEYVPKIRGLSDERSIVSRVLDGERDRVVELPFTEGTLLIFGGRQTLHRVTRVTGERARLVPVLCYSETPDAVNSEAVRKLFWGRTGPAERIGTDVTA